MVSMTSRSRMAIRKTKGLFIRVAFISTGSSSVQIKRSTIFGELIIGRHLSLNFQPKVFPALILIQANVLERSRTIPLLSPAVSVAFGCNFFQNLKGKKKLWSRCFRIKWTCINLKCSIFFFFLGGGMAGVIS